MDRPHQRPVSVLDLVTWNESEELVVSPKFQRRPLWPANASSFLIDTILRGLPIPKLYMRQHLQLDTSRTIREIVDGQQRVRAVLAFRSDQLRLNPAHGPYGGKLYSQLPPKAKEAFLGYEFSVDLLINATDSDVLDIFARINSYSVPLNAQEKRNARFFGAFKHTVYELGLQHLEFWKRQHVLTDAGVARMKEAELTSELLIAMAAGLQDKKKSIDNFYRRWDAKFPNRKRLTFEFKETIDSISQLFAGAVAQTKFHRPALFYSLFLAVFQLRFGGALGKPNRKALKPSRADGLRSALSRLSSELDPKREPSSKYAKFVTAAQRQTDNIEPRRIRHATLLKELTVRS